MAISGSSSTVTDTKTVKRDIATSSVFGGVTQEQVNAASTALGLAPSTDPRRSARDILDLLVNSLEASGEDITSYSASRDIEIIDSASARESYSFSVDMKISLVDPVNELQTVTTPDVPAPVVTPDVPTPAPVVTAPTTSA